MTENTAQKQIKNRRLPYSGINIMFTLLVIILPLILYMFYIEKQENYFRSYYHRTLGNVNQEMARRLEYLKLPMSQWLSGKEEPKKNEWLESLKKDECKPLFYKNKHGVGRYDLTKGIVTAEILREDNSQFAIQVAAVSKKELKTKLGPKIKSTKTTECKATISVADLMFSRNASDHFETLLITNIRGEVVYEAKQAFPPLLKLTPVKSGLSLPFISNKTAKASLDRDALIVPSTFTISEAGNRYNVFCQVLNSAFFIELEYSKTPLFLCGLVKAGKFSREVKTISSNKVLIAVACLLFILLLTPFLKLWLISPNDSYRQVDQVVLRLSFYCLVTLISIGLLDGLRYSTLNSTLNHSMQTIGQKMADNLKEEVAASTNVLGKYDKWADKTFSKGCTEDHCKIKFIKDYGHIEQQGTENPTFLRYPEFEMIGAVNSVGGILGEYEMNVRSTFTGAGSVAHRNYFQKAKYGPRLNTRICGSLLQKGCVIEPIISMEEGVKLTAFSALSNNKIETASGKPFINALFKRLKTFISPVLPLAMQFTVVQNTDGKVLFHSDDRLSLVENFYDEIDENSLIQAIKNLSVQDVVAPSSAKTFYGMYHGVEHSFVIKSLIIPDWTLVILRDLRPLQTLNAEVIIASLTGAFIFLNLLALLVVLTHGLYEHPLGSWVWPNIKHKRQYTDILILFSVLLVTVSWVLYSDIYGIQIITLLCALAVLTMTSVLALLTPERCYQQPWLRNKIRWILPVVSYLVYMYLLADIWQELPNEYIAGALLLINCLIPVYFIWSKKQTSTNKQFCLVRVHTWFAFLYFTIISVIPAWALFESAWVTNIEAYARASLTYRSHAFDQWEQEMRKDMRRIRSDSRMETLSIKNYSVPWIDYLSKEAQANLQTSHESQHIGIHITEFLPVLNSESARLRTFYSSHNQPTGKPGYQWQWDSNSEFTLKRNLNDNTVYLMDDIGEAGSCSKGRDKQPLILIANVHKLPVSMQLWLTELAPLSRLKSALLLLIWMLCLWFLLKKTCNRLFAFEQLDPATRLQIQPINHTNHIEAWEWWVKSGLNRLIIRPDFNIGEKLVELYAQHQPKSKVRIIDLGKEYSEVDIVVSDVSNAGHLSAKDIAEYSVFVLENFESRLREPAFLKENLKLLVKLLETENKTVHIVSQVDLPHCLQVYFRYNTNADILSTTDEKNWVKVLSKFHKVHSEFSRKDWREISSEPEAILQRECGWLNKLDQVSLNIRQTPDFIDMHEKDIVSIVSDQAEIYFSEQWQFCSNIEKRTLYYLALGHQFNPQTALVMQCLMQRNLIKRDPQFMVVSESFRLFILQAEPLEHIKKWENTSSDSLWSSLKMPLIGLLLVTAGILFYNQPETFQEIAAFIAALTAGAPLLLRFFALSMGEK